MNYVGRENPPAWRRAASSSGTSFQRTKVQRVETYSGGIVTCTFLLLFFETAFTMVGEVVMRFWILANCESKAPSVLSRIPSRARRRDLNQGCSQCGSGFDRSSLFPKLPRHVFGLGRVVVCNAVREEVKSTVAIDVS